MDAESKSGTHPTAGMVGVGELFKNSWSIFSDKFWVLAGIMSLPAFLMFLATAIGEPVGGLINLAGVVVSILAQAGLVLVILNRQSETSVSTAYKMSMTKFWSYLWVVIITAFLVIGASFLLIIPGIIFTVWFIFAAVVRLGEDEKGMSALLKSRAYVQNYFWAVFGRYLLLGLVLGFGSALVVGILSGLSGNDKIIIGLASAIVVAMATPFASIYLILMYENLKKIKGDQVTSVDPRTKKIALGVGIAGWVVMTVIIIAVGVAALSVVSGWIGANFGPRLDRPAVNLQEENFTEKIKDLENELKAQPVRNETETSRQ